MKNTDYNKKRKDLKDEKREGLKERFEDTRHRKAFVEDIKRSFRSVKRSEKQIIKKEIIDDAYGLGEDFPDYDDEYWTN